MTISDGTSPAAAAAFPIRWERHEDALAFWAQDRMGNPEPLPPLEAAFFDELYTEPFRRAAAAYELGIRARTLLINTYLYVAIESVPAPPAEAAAQAARAREKLTAAMARLDELWRDELLPEVQAHLDHWERFDLGGATQARLLAHLDDAIERYRRIYEIHFLIIFPVLLAISDFDDFYQELFGRDDRLGAYRLLQGLGNRTMEGNRALWRLSRRALAAAPVREALARQAAADVPAALERSADGRQFLAELTAHLGEYGQRGDRWGMSTPFWVEDPTPLVQHLKEYVAQPDRDLEAELDAVAAARERLLGRARARLAGRPAAVVERFERLLGAAQTATVLSEDHGEWIDFRGAYQIRRLLMELGRRLTAGGALEQPADVFCLTLDELRATAAALPSVVDRRRLVAERRAEMERFRAVSPPPTLGTPPDSPPDDPVSRALGKMFDDAPERSTESTVLRGNAASAGTARGPARVIRQLADAARLRPGDVLVTETTAPPWTPLFAIAAAVVTDTGGILSHCAVVAREYGIPAVVGTGDGSSIIRDGQIVEVDGAAGIVRLV